MKPKEMQMITLENKNPTDTEKKMFSFGGLYLVESNEYILKYARINTNIEDFPTSININSYYIEWEHIITFHLFPAPYIPSPTVFHPLVSHAANWSAVFWQWEHQ